MTAPTTHQRRRGRPANTPTHDTVARVIAAARRAFAAHGYAGTSNQAMARAAGLSHTAVYNHFGSKAALFTAVFVDVQDRLIAELARSARSAPGEPPLPGVLIDALEALRDDDPSYVEFLASMYTEVRRHPELRAAFQGGQRFSIFDTLRELCAAQAGAVGSQAGAVESETAEDAVWFWITFALGLAQLSTLADPATFAATVVMFRAQFQPPVPAEAPAAPAHR